MRRRGLGHWAALLAPPLMLLVLTCAGAEAWLRVSRFGTAGLAHPLAFAPPAYRPVDCIPHGPRGELMTPNCRMRYKGVEIATNSRGLNDREVDESRPHYRIAVLGDSVTMAAGVPQRSAYHALLEERLDRELGQPGFVELYNLGRGGRSTSEEVGDLEREVARGPLDGALVGVVPSDFIDNVLRTQGCHDGDEADLLSPEERDFYDSAVLGNNPFSFVLKLVESRTALWTLEWMSDQGRAVWRRFQVRPDGAAAMADIEARARRLFRSCALRMREIADGAGVDLAWALVWYEPGGHASAILDVLHELGEPVVSMVDVGDAFPSRESMFVYPGDNHPNAAVHRIFADRLHGYFDELGWLEKIRRRYQESSAGRNSSTSSS